MLLHEIIQGINRPGAQNALSEYSVYPVWHRGGTGCFPDVSAAKAAPLTADVIRGQLSAAADALVAAQYAAVCWHWYLVRSKCYTRLKKGMLFANTYQLNS